MKIVVEFKFPKNFNKNISDKFIFGDVLKSIPFTGVSMKVVNRMITGTATFDSIEKSVSDFTGVPISEIQVKKRSRKVVEARQICHYLSKKHIKPKESLSSIGSRFGNKDHATVLHSCKTVENLLQTDFEYRSNYKPLIESFK